MLDLTPLYYIGGVLFLLYFLVLRPRRGGKDAPPTVLSSPVFPGPIGMAIEFGKGPVAMIQRCYELYGGVFTIPVSTLLDFFYSPEGNVNKTTSRAAANMSCSYFKWLTSLAS